MAVTDQQIRAVLAANPNASPERIMKALTRYGIAPERFERVTGVSLGLGSQATSAPPAIAPAPTTLTTPTPAPVTITETFDEPAISPAPASSPLQGRTAAPAQSGVTDQMIRDALAANPDATPERIARAMQNYGVTPADVRRATGRTFAENADVRQAFGQRGGYTDQQVRDAVMGRAGEQGFASQPEIQKAAQNYGISEEQLSRVFPQVQADSFNQMPVVSREYGLPAAISSIGRTADVTAGTSRQGQQELLGRIGQVGQVTGGLYDEAQGYQQQFRDIGAQAAQRQAALTGALGPEAQAQAFAEYQASPALDYLQQQGERALTRNAAALGGLGGGNVRRDLMKLTADLYGQDYQNQLARLGDIAQRGYGAGATSAQLGGQEAQIMAGLGRTGATTAAQMQDALSGRLGNILTREADYRMQTGRDVSNVMGGAATQIGRMQVGTADQMGNIYGNLTNQQLQTYQDLYNRFGDAYANQYLNQANLYQNQGSAYAGVPGQTYTPVQPYDFGAALDAGGQAFDLASTMFPTTSSSNVPPGTDVTLGGGYTPPPFPDISNLRVINKG